MTDKKIDIHEGSKQITETGSSELPSYVRSQIDSLPEVTFKTVRKLPGINKNVLGVSRSLFVSNRAYIVLLWFGTTLWFLSTALLIGACVNYAFLEKININATSHDARIEEVSTPIKLE